MTQPEQQPLESFFSNFFKVIADKRSYVNLCYSLLAFPFGLFYFIFLTTGFSVGVGLIPIFAGLPIILFMFYISKRFTAFECIMARAMLHTPVPTPPDRIPRGLGFFRRLKAEICDGDSWKSIIYLFIKFPLGIFTFTTAVTLLSVSLGLAFSPAVWYILEDRISIDIFEHDLFYLLWPGMLEPSEKGAIYCVAGILLFFVSLHVINLITRISTWFLRVMTRDWN